MVNEKHTQELGAMETNDSSNDTFKSAEFGETNRIEAKQHGSHESGDMFESIKDDDKFDDEEYRRKTRRRLIIIVISIVILVLVTIGAIIGVLVPKHLKNNPSLSIDEIAAIVGVCNSTLYPDSCYSSIYSLKMSSTNNPASSPVDSPIQIFILSLQVKKVLCETINLFFTFEFSFILMIEKY